MSLQSEFLQLDLFEDFAEPYPVYDIDISRTIETDSRLVMSVLSKKLGIRTSRIKDAKRRRSCDVRARHYIYYLLVVSFEYRQYEVARLFSKERSCIFKAIASIEDLREYHIVDSFLNKIEKQLLEMSNGR